MVVMQRIGLTAPHAMKASSRPKVPFAKRTYVLKDTAVMDRPRNTHEMTMMVSGNPFGAIILASGSTFGFSIGADLGKSRWTNTRPPKFKTAMPQRGAPPYTEEKFGSDYGKHQSYSVDRYSSCTTTESFRSFKVITKVDGRGHTPVYHGRRVARPNSFMGMMSLKVCGGNLQALKKTMSWPNFPWTQHPIQAFDFLGTESVE